MVLPRLEEQGFLREVFVCPVGFRLLQHLLRERQEEGCHSLVPLSLAAACLTLQSSHDRLRYDAPSAQLRVTGGKSKKLSLIT